MLCNPPNSSKLHERRLGAEDEGEAWEKGCLRQRRTEMGWSQLGKAKANEKQSSQRIREAKQRATQKKKKSRASKGQRLFGYWSKIKYPCSSEVQFKNHIIQII